MKILKLEINIYFNKWYILAIILFSIFICFLILDKLFPIYTVLDYSTTVKSREGIVMSSFLSKDDKWRYKTELSEISPFLKKSIIFKEDKYFYYHFGINPVSILRAFFDNFFSGKRKSGASTITMQTVRMLEPKKRTYFNKLIEMFRALQLEFHHSKDDILELYLNKIPFGGNIEGVGAASVLYFAKDPSKLSIAESAALAVIPNNPSNLNIKFKQNSINFKKNQLLKLLKNNDIFPTNLIDDALNEMIVPRRLPSPETAPHLCRKAVREMPNYNVINTTINFTIQSNFEKVIADYIAEWNNYGINNAACLVIDNRNSEIIAYIGSEDFRSKKGGQIDGVRTVRSPGSTLKPLLFAAAIDKGLITPKLSLLDVPILDSEYSPSNFDGKFRGRVTAAFALPQSLNVPAVNLLKEYGFESFRDLLIQYNFKSIERYRNKVGLSLILGGCGVTLEELCNMYSAFASMGDYRKAAFLKNTNSLKEKLISPEAAYLVTEILKLPQRPDYPLNYKSAKSVPKIAWKTGTSQGRRDAWAIGYNSTYTIGVWAGNFTGKSNPMISGANVTVPLLFELFNTLSIDDKSDEVSVPEGLDIRLVDATTGLLPSAHSKNVVEDYYIPGVSFSKVTEHLQNIRVSNDEKISYCSDCMPDAGVQQKVYEIFPFELQYYFQTNNIYFLPIPPHNPKCTTAKDGVSPSIISPVANSEYFIETDTHDKIVLKAGLNSGSAKLFWFVNNKFLTQAGKNNSLDWLPEESGNYKITCVDENGLSSSVTIKVKYF